MTLNGLFCADYSFSVLLASWTGLKWHIPPILGWNTPPSLLK